MPTTFPASVDVFTVKRDDTDLVRAADVNNLQDAVAALEGYLIPGGGTAVVHIAGTETITGPKTFSATAVFTAGANLAGPVVIGTDPGGGQLLRVGGQFHVSGAAVFDTNINNLGAYYGNVGGALQLMALGATGAIQFYSNGGATGVIASIDATGKGTFNGGASVVGDLNLTGTPRLMMQGVPTITLASPNRVQVGGAPAQWWGVDISAGGASTNGEAPIFQSLARTLTVTAGWATQRSNLFLQETITASTPQTITNAATLAIAGPPIVAGSAVVTNPYALWVQSGKTRLEDDILMANGRSLVVGTSLSYYFSGNAGGPVISGPLTLANSITLPVGSTSSPSLIFAGRITDGLYSPAVNQLGVVLNNTEVARFSTAVGLSFPLDNTYDIGASGARPRNVYVGGQLYIGAGGQYLYWTGTQLQFYPGDFQVASGRLLLSSAAAKIVPGVTSLSLRNNADTADNLLVSDAGTVTTRSNLVVTAGGLQVTAGNIVQLNGALQLTDGANALIQVHSSAATGDLYIRPKAASNGIWMDVGGLFISGTGGLTLLGATRIFSTVTTGNNILQWWKDSTPTAGWTTGMSGPASALSDHFIFNAWSGTSWYEVARFLNAGGLQVTKGGINLNDLTPGYQINGIALLDYSGGDARINAGGAWRVRFVGSSPTGPNEQTTFQVDGPTFSATAGIGTQRFALFGVPTITAATAQTIVTAATVAIAGAPISAGSAVITYPYSFWVQAGYSRFDGWASFAGLNSTSINPNLGGLDLRTTDAAGLDVGPAIAFLGETGNGATPYKFAMIRGTKNSTTAGDYSGRLELLVVGSTGGRVSALTLSASGAGGANVQIPNGGLSLPAATGITNFLTIGGIQLYDNTFGVLSIGGSANLGINGGNLYFFGANARLIPGATSFSLRNNANDANNLVISDAGTVTVPRGNLQVGYLADVANTGHYWALGAAGGGMTLVARGGGDAYIQPYLHLSSGLAVTGEADFTNPNQSLFNLNTAVANASYMGWLFRKDGLRHAGMRWDGTLLEFMNGSASQADPGVWTLPVFSLDISKGNILLGINAVMATNAGDGFPYIPTMAGTPTTIPTSYTGRVPIVYDTTGHKLWIYDGGWKSATFA